MSELFKPGQVLGRAEMKKIMAGSGGNIYCNIGGTQYPCSAGDLTYCLDACVTLADLEETYCAGCAQFP